MIINDNSINKTIISLIFSELIKKYGQEEIGKNYTIEWWFAFKSPEYVDEGILVLRVTNINKDWSIDFINDCKYYPTNDISENIWTYLLKEGDVLLVMVGWSLGKVGYVTSNCLPALLNQNLWKITGKQSNFNTKYTFFLVKYLSYTNIKITQSTHWHLSRTEYRKRVIPNIPWVIQLEIANFLEQLFAQGIEALLNIPNCIWNLKDSLRNLINKEKEAKNIDSLILKYEQSAIKLKSSILQDAIQWKLVPQDPSDEPASILIEKIQVEKIRLIAEWKLKKQKPLAPIKPEEISYELPKGWEWVKLGDIWITQTWTTPSTANPQYYWGELPFIKPWDISDNWINYNNESISVIWLPYVRIIREDSLVMVCIGWSIWKCYFTNQKISCNQQLNAISWLSSISARFIYYFVSSIYFFSKVWELAKWSATPIVNKSEWENISFPLPPLQEQKRIVEKIDELMKSCVLLDEQVKLAKERSERLIESILQRVFNW